MDVDRPQLGDVQNLLREKLAERRRHAQIGREAFERLHPFRALDALRLKDGNPRRDSRFLYRAGAASNHTQLNT